MDVFEEVMFFVKIKKKWRGGGAGQGGGGQGGFERRREV